MAKISANGARAIGTHKVTRRDEGDNYDVVYSYTLCSDGRVLVKHVLKYDDRRYSSTGNYRVWARINDPEKRTMAYLRRALERRGMEIAA